MKLGTIVLAGILALGLTSCSDAEVASRKASD